MSADLFGQPIPEPHIKGGKTKEGRPKINPLIAIYGICLDTSKKCGECQFHYFKQYASAYPKCGLREQRSKHHGASTDHSSRYNACAKFSPKT